MLRSGRCLVTLVILDAFLVIAAGGTCVISILLLAGVFSFPPPVVLLMTKLRLNYRSEEALSDLMLANVYLNAFCGFLVSVVGAVHLGLVCHELFCIPALGHRRYRATRDLIFSGTLERKPLIVY